MRFLGTTTEEAYFWRTDDYFVSEMPLSSTVEDASIRLRLSETAIASLLTHALGPRNTPSNPGYFQLADLSGYEAQLVAEFAKSVFGNVRKSLVHKKPDAKQLLKDREVTHLVWVLRSRAPVAPPATGKHTPPAPPLQFMENTTEAGKLIISIPTAALNVPTDARLAIRPIRDTFFMDATSPARIGLGFTRVPLADIKALEDGDIVVLTDSNHEQMLLLDSSDNSTHAEKQIRLPFSADLGSWQTQISLPFTQDIADMQNDINAQQNLWDNLTIEVGAEFEPIRLPLKQLRQMSEGLVVEVGDLLNNHVQLKVEGKTLAQGELVIVGDKFGVRVSKIDGDREGSGTAIAAPTASKTAVKAPAKTAEKPPAVDSDDMAPPAEGDSKAKEADGDFLDDDFDDDDW